VLLLPRTSQPGQTANETEAGLDEHATLLAHEPQQYQTGKPIAAKQSMVSPAELDIPPKQRRSLPAPTRGNNNSHPRSPAEAFDQTATNRNVQIHIGALEVRTAAPAPAAPTMPQSLGFARYEAARAYARLGDS
jgi:hypothetical protein